MKKQIFNILAEIVKKASGIDMNRVDITNDYINLGFDSLVVVRIDQGIRKQFNIEIDMGLYYEELDSLAKLLDYIAANLPPDWESKHPLSASAEAVADDSIFVKSISEPISIESESVKVPSDAQNPLMMPVCQMSGNGLSGLEKLLGAQMQAMSDLMHRQLDVLGAYGNRTSGKPALSREVMVPGFPAASASPPVTSDILSKPETPEAPPKPKMSEIRAMKFDPDRLNDSQKAFLDRFIPPYITRTKSSKEYARKYRPALADWINTLGFRRSIKEIVYPIVAERSAGSRVWDIDGNEYVDIAMGYGVNLFGHSPAFVTEAIQEQLARGVELGPQNRVVGEVAKLISDMTGMDRVAFCNTGSEAVMMALRAAQAITRKERIAVFMGSYHGNSDLVIKDTLLLRYGEESALKIIRENAHELAVVLVEPVQSRNPSLQPKEFLHALRALTTELGIILVFDEMINGFRCHPGGAQAIFGVRADMATYGKVPAGGMPIGIVAGSKECMKVIDGGLWDYGDESVPGQEVIFFGGTFCKHPLTMAAARASLLHMKSKGPVLQEDVNRRTEGFAKEVNAFFEHQNVGIRISWFASQFIFEPTIPLYKQPVPPPDMTVWFHLLISKGIYTWERRVCFFSEAHTDDDVKKAVQAIKESVLELKAAGFPLFGGGNDNPPEKKKIDILTYETTKTGLSEGSEAINLPLTQAQQQLWFLSQLNENAVPAYIETIAVRLTGTLDQKKLSGAASDLVARHPALRTVMVGDGQNQRILPTISCEIEITKASDVPKLDNYDPMQTWLAKNSRATFDLINGPLFSFKLLQLDPKNHVLAMNFHHIVMDGRSVNVLLRDLICFYTARVTGTPFNPAPAPDLRAYQNWLKEYLESTECSRDQDFWKRLFPETIPMLDFPADNTRPSIFNFKGARHHLAADPKLLANCLSVGRSRRLTPFMTMISLYTLWIHKLTGRDEVVIGFPVSGRFFEESDELVGYCTHLVPFVSRYDANISFVQYLDKSRETLAAAYSHQKYPFGQLIRNLHFEQDLSRGSVIASEFNLDQMQDLPPLEGLKLSLIDIPLSYVKYDFNLEIMEVAGQYQFKFEYATALFERETVARMADHFMTLLENVSSQPEQPLRKISLLTPDQRYKLLTLWNETARDFPLDQPFHRLFEAQALITPDRIAASFADLDGPDVESGYRPNEEMSYQELNSHANRLARQLTTALKERSTRPPNLNLINNSNLSSNLNHNLESTPLIPILADRSCRFLVAMLGVFKAGCAYLPLDPEHPSDRIGGILKQSGAKLILAEKRFSPLLEAALAGQSKSVFSDKPDSSGKTDSSGDVDSPSILWFEECICHSPLTTDDDKNLYDNPKADSPETLAYVIFTSGSTGLPKGAMVKQKGMVNHLYAKIVDLEITTDDVLAQNASQCFDISVWQFLSPLLKGGRVEIMSSETAHDPGRLVEVVARQNVTILEVVPSLLRVLLEQMEENRLTSVRLKSDGVAGRTNTGRINVDGKRVGLSGLRWLVPTGEALPPLLCTQWFEHYPETSVLNAYGPTECSDDVAHYRLNHAPAPNSANIPIGRPVANMRLYILDNHLEPVPIGVVGELWVGGVGVGLGYLNQPDLTSKVFIPDPFNPGTDARLYRTGDLAQFLPDGNILFLGRVDHQVKIRGFRIELGEIEAVLARHPSVKELVVTAPQERDSSSTGGSIQTGLTAYVVFNVDDSDTDSERIDKLRNYLSDRLPGYMVPASFVPMEKLPLTSNGKIDRKALLALYSVTVESSAPFTPPRNDTEQAIAEVLAGVLNREAIGIHDNYFALGGDSIQAIQAVARIQSRGYILKLRDIFQYPTVAELAPRLTRRTRRIDQGVVTGPVKATPLQRWLLSQDSELIHHYNQAVTLNFTTKLKVASLQAALESLAIHHDALRITVTRSADQMLNIEGSGLTVRGVDLKPELVVTSFNPKVKSKQATEAIFKETSQKLHASIDLQNGPLIKAALFQGEKQDTLLLVIHHLCVDAISWSILIPDLISAYNSHVNGEAIELPGKTDSFQYWSEQLHQIVTGSEDENRYWEALSREQFMQLPFDLTDYNQINQSAIDKSQANQNIDKSDINPNNGLHQDTAMVEITLPAQDTAILTGKAQVAYHTDMNDLLLTAIAKGLQHWGNINGILVSLEGHGRDSIDQDIDISRTVGWFTVAYPALIKLPQAEQQSHSQNGNGAVLGVPTEIGMQIKHVKESLHQIPNRGFNFGLIRENLTPETRQRLEPSISFNYIGIVDAEASDKSSESKRTGKPDLILRIEPSPHIDLLHPKLKRQYALEIEAEIRQSSLHIQLYYSQNHYRQETIRRLGAIVKDCLIQVIDHCSSRKMAEVTPSDLTWSHLSISAFETLLNDHGLKPTEVQDIYPLTPMQENMLFHRLYSADSTAYFEQFSFNLKGDLNIKWFEQAWKIVSLRHDILHTNFIYRGVPRPLQVVRKMRPIEWNYQDLSDVENPEARIAAFKIDERQQGFDLEHDILMRMNIFKLEADRYAAIWSYHHILMDGWCLGVLIQDVQHAYMELSRGRKPQFTLAPQYREYIRWLEMADHAGALGYWSAYLDGFTPLTSLPRDLQGVKHESDGLGQASEDGQNGQIAKLQSLYGFELDSNMSRQLSQMARDRQITINTLVQCVWGLLLAELNGVSDVVFGAAVSGRPAEVPDVEQIVGLFINTVPVRVRLPELTSFGELAKTLQAESISSEPHHFVSLASIQTASGVENALIDHVLIFQNYPLGDELEELQKEYNAGFTFSDLEALEETNYDLSVEIYPLPNLHFDLRYNPFAYSIERISAVAKDITTLFEAVEKNPEITVGELRRLLTSADELGAEADFLAAAMNIDDDF